MPYRLQCQISGWGGVRNPLNEDEVIPVCDDEIVVDNEELAHALEAEHGALELVDEPDSVTEDGDIEADNEETVDAPFDPGDYTVSELQDALPGDYSDDEREALAAAEHAGKDRSSAIDMLKR